jgi:predicted Zn-dependent protease
VLHCKVILTAFQIQEKEADHIGLILMAQAGFDPKARIEYFEKHHEKEKKMLNGRDPMPESMSTHPSVSQQKAFV